jgi:hypothetical protein
MSLLGGYALKFRDTVPAFDKRKCSDMYVHSGRDALPQTMEPCHRLPTLQGEQQQ